MAAANKPKPICISISLLLLGIASLTKIAVAWGVTIPSKVPSIPSSITPAIYFLLPKVPNLNSSKKLLTVSGKGL